MITVFELSRLVAACVEYIGCRNPGFLFLFVEITLEEKIKYSLKMIDVNNLDEMFDDNLDYGNFNY